METGRKFSEEHKRKISISNMGKKCPWVTGEKLKGRKYTEDHKNKIRMSSRLSHPPNDLTGQIFGLLTVIRRADIERKLHSRIEWECLCECGQIKLISSSNLKSKNTTSCGCRQKAILKQLTADRAKTRTGDQCKNAAYYTYLKRAAKKEIEFSLTIQEFINICEQDCYYCGRAPSNRIVNPYNNGDFIYNGIDRTDNKLGYTLDNSVPCCKKCNTAKGEMSFFDFISHIETILNNVKSSGTFKVRVIQ